MIASNLGVDKATVSRTINLFHTTGKVTKRSYPSDRANRTLTTPGQLFILDLVVKKPGIYLREIQQELHDFLIVDVSICTICKFLHQSGFTRQRLHNVALQQDAFLRQQYIQDMSVYSPDMMVFVDETGADQRNCLHKYGYSIHGKPATYQQIPVISRRKSISYCLHVHKWYFGY